MGSGTHLQTTIQLKEIDSILLELVLIIQPIDIGLQIKTLDISMTAGLRIDIEMTDFRPLIVVSYLFTDILGGLDVSPIPNRRFDTGSSIRHTFGVSKLGSIEDSRREQYGSVLRGHKRLLESDGLPDMDEYQLFKEGYYETVKKLGIDNRMKNWIVHTREWIHEGILKTLIKHDHDNLIKICKFLAQKEYNLVFIKDSKHSKYMDCIVPYEYEKI